MCRAISFVLHSFDPSRSSRIMVGELADSSPEWHLSSEICRYWESCLPENLQTVNVISEFSRNTPIVHEYLSVLAAELWLPSMQGILPPLLHHKPTRHEMEDEGFMASSDKALLIPGQKGSFAKKIWKVFVDSTGRFLLKFKAGVIVRFYGCVDMGGCISVFLIKPNVTCFTDICYWDSAQCVKRHPLLLCMFFRYWLGMSTQYISMIQAKQISNETTVFISDLGQFAGWHMLFFYENISYLERQRAWYPQTLGLVHAHRRWSSPRYRQYPRVRTHQYIQIPACNYKAIF